jgi:glucose uptake protein GlcU
LLLEALPIEACLLIVTAANNLRLGAIPIPFWITLALLATSYVLGRALGGRASRATMAVTMGLFFVAAIVIVNISPSGYGGVAGSRLQAVSADLATASPRIYAALGLVALTLYIWWRGYSNGRRSPTADLLLRRFTFGMVAIVVSIASAATFPQAQRQFAIGALAIILPVEVYCVLVAMTIARISQERMRRGSAGSAEVTDSRWLGTALVLAALVVGASLAVSIVVNYDSVGALLAQLGPVGAALDTAAQWVVEAIAQILFFLLNGIISGLKGRAGAPHVSAPHGARCVPTAQHPCTKLPPPVLPPEWAHAVTIAVQIIVTLAVLAIVIWVLRSIMSRRRDLSPAAPGVDEERESLSASTLFRSQLRALLDRLGRRDQRSTEDTLTPGTVRYLYRQVLRAAAGRDLARMAAETPDEYSARLSRTGPLAVGDQGERQDLAALTGAYSQARYGDREPESADRAQVRQAAERIMRRLGKG